MDEIKNDNQNNSEENQTDNSQEKIDKNSVDDILELAKMITELKKIKKRLQAQINFSKKREPSKEENPQKEGNSPEQ